MSRFAVFRQLTARFGGALGAASATD